MLTSIADLGLEDPGLLRIVGYKLSNEGLLRQAAAVFGRVLRLREKEPQSWRDLGNVRSNEIRVDIDGFIISFRFLPILVFTRERSSCSTRSSLANGIPSMDDTFFFYILINSPLSYSEIELTVLMEANRVIDIVNRKKLKVAHEIDPQLVYNMPCDLRISCGWDTNDTGA